MRLLVVGGGTAGNRGPAPVRTLARAARLARDRSSWEAFGLRGPAPEPDLPAIRARSAEVARHAREAKQLAAYLRGYGVELAEHTDHVSFTDPHTLTATDGRSWTGDRVIGVGQFPRARSLLDPVG